MDNRYLSDEELLTIHRNSLEKIICIKDIDFYKASTEYLFKKKDGLNCIYSLDGTFIMKTYWVFHRYFRKMDKYREQRIKEILNA